MFSPADESDEELAGEIVDFEWREKDGCYVCVIRDKDNEDWPVGVSGIPKMVREADQADVMSFFYTVKVTMKVTKQAQTLKKQK